MKPISGQNKTLVALLLVFAPTALATQLATEPLNTQSMAKPNVIFGMDDSGSMDFELMLRTNDGAMWWSTSAKSAIDSNGQPNFYPSGVSSSSWLKYAYLFPNGCATETRRLCDSTNDHFAVPPTPQFAWTRSAQYNPLYYDPSTLYIPWPEAYLTSKLQSFGNANPADTPSHPLFTSKGKDPDTFHDLTTDWEQNASNWNFQFMPGMSIPKGTRYRTGSGSWKTASNVINVSSKSSYGIGFYPATYWVREACTVNNTDCASAPDGKTLKRYEIRPGNTFPSGRSYAAEMQNFANWFTYYRKRKLMLSSAMGAVLTDLRGVRAGLVQFNSHKNVTMLDLDSTKPAENGQALAGLFYSNPSSGGTPTRETLKFIGEQYRTKTNVIQHSCQRNAAFLVTDGFAYANKVSPPSYNENLYGKGAPYEKTYDGSIADIALSYYTNTMRSGHFLTGKVPPAPDIGPATDRNIDLHMNTHAITLGARGTLWTGSENAYALEPNWPDPKDDRSPTSVDDLWHATVNGRGLMLSADNPQETFTAMRQVLTEILRQAGSQTAVTTSTVNPNLSNNMAYVGLYVPGGWSGDLRGHTVGLTDGALSVQPAWSAATLLDARDWTTRRIATADASGGVEFTANAVGDLVKGSSSFEREALIDYLRGNRALEGTTYRARSARLGAIVNGEAVLGPDNTLYQVANDGMVHAFDADTGEERWAFLPSFVLPNLAAYATPGWAYRPMLDATPAVGKVGNKHILVGGAGAAARRFYALDVTSGFAASDAEVAAKVLWEFPKGGDLKEMGYSFGKPTLVKTAKYGDVVLLTSGYNSTKDGKGRVFVLDALTGEPVKALEDKLVTTDGALGADAGLAQLSVFLDTGSDIANYAYAGDERGNLWRFSLDTGDVQRIARLRDVNGNPQPVTSAPELTMHQGKRIIVVGTGRLLATADFSDKSPQSFYVLSDTGVEITDVRKELHKVELEVSGLIRTTKTGPVNWSSQRGWYVDLAGAERVNTDPSLVFGAVVFTANEPSVLACESRSFLYVLSIATGMQQPPEQFAEGVTPYAGLQIGVTFTTRPAVTRLPNGKLMALQRFFDNTGGQIELPIRTNTAPRKAAWREVLR